MQTETITQGFAASVAARIAEGSKSLEEVASAARVPRELLAVPDRMTIRELIAVCIVLGVEPAHLFTAETVTR